MKHAMGFDAADAHEDGFTLIELLVVIIIIGVLASIAIPVFLRQRQQGYDAQAKSDLRNLAGFEEVYLSDSLTYGSIAQIQAEESQFHFTQNVVVSVVRYSSATGFCLSAKHISSPETWWYDSQAGGMLPRGTSGCPVTTTGTNGDTITG
jgi:type IV pilus assembly protein PilA